MGKVVKPIPESARCQRRFGGSVGSGCGVPIDQACQCDILSSGEPCQQIEILKNIPYFSTTKRGALCFAPL